MSQTHVLESNENHFVKITISTQALQLMCLYQKYTCLMKYMVYFNRLNYSGNFLLEIFNRIALYQTNQVIPQLQIYIRELLQYKLIFRINSNK